MKQKRKCSDCGYEEEWKRPTKIGLQRAVKESGWQLWRNVGWCCWPCSEDRKRAKITPEQVENAKKRFPVLNTERHELISKKFTKGLTPKEERRFNRLQRQTSELIEIMHPQLNTAYFRKVQGHMQDARKRMRQVQKLLDESEAKQIKERKA